MTETPIEESFEKPITIKTMAIIGIGLFLMVALCSRSPTSSVRTVNDLTFDELRAATETAIRSNLNDPASAQFVGVHNGGSPGTVCGRFNAKNGFGGYVPFRRFYALSSKPVIGEQLEIEPVTKIERAAQPDFDEHYFANCGPER